MRLTEELTTGVKRVINAWQGFAYIISPPVVRLIGMGNSTSGQEALSSKSMFGKWTPARESWWTSTSSTYENITSVGDTLTSCYSLLESSWSVRSKGLRFLSELKLKHLMSLCKTFLNLALLHVVRENHYTAEYWFTVNLVTSITSTLLFIMMGILLQRLRRSNRIRAKLERFLPTSKAKETKPWGIKKKKKKDSSNIQPNLPFPQIDPGYQQYCEMLKKSGVPGFYPTYPSAPYPTSNYPVPRPAQMTNIQERAVVPGHDNSDPSTREVVTVQQHQERVNRELAELENGRNGGQA